MTPAADIEMSRYIDLEQYHRAIKTHPFCEEMLAAIITQVKRYLNDDETRVVELGSGTGAFTRDLAKINTVKISAIEIDKNCCHLLRKHLSKYANVDVVQDDMITFQSDKKFDIAVSTFSHDHCHYDKAFEFARNINKNLKLHGVYIIGNELIPKFENEEERKNSLKLYHNFIINKAISEGYHEIAEIEKEALHSGLNRIGDFKRHEAMLEEEMTAAGFKLVKKEKIGPLDTDKVGGVYVLVFQKIKEL